MVSRDRGETWTKDKDFPSYPRYQPRAGEKPSLAQKSGNIDVDTARDTIKNIFDRLAKPGETPRQVLRRISRKASATGRDNPNFDPQAEKIFLKAVKRQIGSDKDYTKFIRWLNTAKGKTAAGGASTATKKFRFDPRAGKLVPVPETADEEKLLQMEMDREEKNRAIEQRRTVR